MRFLSLLVFTALLACAADPFLVRNARLFDGTRIIPASDVAVANGRILAIGHNRPVPAGALIVDGTGKTLLPGLIDAHVHIAVPGRFENEARLWSNYVPGYVHAPPTGRGPARRTDAWRCDGPG